MSKDRGEGGRAQAEVAADANAAAIYQFLDHERTAGSTVDFFPSVADVAIDMPDGTDITVSFYHKLKGNRLMRFRELGFADEEMAGGVLRIIMEDKIDAWNMRFMALSGDGEARCVTGSEEGIRPTALSEITPVERNGVDAAVGLVIAPVQIRGMFGSYEGFTSRLKSPDLTGFETPVGSRIIIEDGVVYSNGLNNAVIEAGKPEGSYVLGAYRVAKGVQKVFSQVS